MRYCIGKQWLKHRAHKWINGFKPIHASNGVLRKIRWMSKLCWCPESHLKSGPPRHDLNWPGKLISFHAPTQKFNWVSKLSDWFIDSSKRTFVDDNFGVDRDDIWRAGKFFHIKLAPSFALQTGWCGAIWRIGKWNAAFHHPDAKWPKATVTLPWIMLQGKLVHRGQTLHCLTFQKSVKRKKSDLRLENFKLLVTFFHKINTPGKPPSPLIHFDNQ